MCWLARSDSHGRGGVVRVMGEQAERVERTLVTPAGKMLVLPVTIGADGFAELPVELKIEVPHHSKVELQSI